MQIEFETDNDAFEGNDTIEIVRILRLVASQIERGSRSAPVLDINGNRVGAWHL